MTIVSFTVFTKWWHVEIDEYREILRGFPLPFVCPGWHTSMSLQIFVLEFIVDMLVYFSFWFIIIMAVSKTVKSFRVPKSVTIALLVISGLLTTFLTMLAINPDNIYSATRPFDIKSLETGYRFIWQDEARPNYDKYPYKK